MPVSRCIRRLAAMSSSRAPGSRAMHSGTRAWQAGNLQFATQFAAVYRKILLVFCFQYRLWADTGNSGRRRQVPGSAQGTGHGPGDPVPLVRK